MNCPSLSLKKYQSLGNDYFVGDRSHNWSHEEVQRLCDRHYGFGSDGLLLDSSKDGVFKVKIYNPDGSLAEKSGNGLRIFARYLWDRGDIAPLEWVPVVTDGGMVGIYVEENGEAVRVQMGKLLPAHSLFDFTKEVLHVALDTGERCFDTYAVSLGNPHAVIFLEKAPTLQDARLYGPLIEHHARFPERTNVQFVYVRDRQTLVIEIWERGAGYTLASGSSASAVAGLAYHLGLIESEVAVCMPGGSLQVSVSEDLSITQSGPVSFIGACQWVYESFSVS